MKNETIVTPSTTEQLLCAVAVVSTVFLMVVIIYGADSIIPGAHDTFHDFRHSIGITCH